MALTVTQPATPSPELLRRFDIAGPRYTSYPTADRFVEAFDDADYGRILEQTLGAPGRLAALSLYVHIPFCESLCYYCACNKIITKHHNRGTLYLAYLAKELALHTAIMGTRQPLGQLHLGGGSPTFLSDAELAGLMALLRANFSFTAKPEIAIEVDPRTVSVARLQTLADLGFNRLSFGVQDFDPYVQVAIHRVQSTQQVFDLVHAARERGLESINIDLIYGLPKQTLASMERTLEQVIKLRPDRIALYAYAHLPQRFKPQRRIHAEDLPDGGTKVAMLAHALEVLVGAGYVYVGMDHFALPDDALAVAKRQGRLHRNFQGYSTRPDCDLIALGVSSIGRIGNTYSQNAKTLDDYYALLDQGRFPVVRGLAVSRDAMLRRTVIMALMCQGTVEFEVVSSAWMIDFTRYFAAELRALQPLAQEGLLTVDAHGIRVSNKGWFFVRAIAMVFDSYLQEDLSRERFSRIL